MKLKIIFVLVSIPFFLSAQNEKPTSATINIGRSYTGTGDMTGLQFGVLFQKCLKNNQFSWSTGIEATLHNSENIDFFWTTEDGNEIKGKSRYLTSGFQLLALIGYDFLANTKNSLGISIGPLVRYQSSNIPDMSEILYPVITDLPYPIKIDTFTEPMRTLAIGATLKLQYNYTFQNNLLVGFMPSFQFDTNGDTIAYFALAIGKKF